MEGGEGGSRGWICDVSKHKEGESTEKTAYIIYTVCTKMDDRFNKINVLNLKIINCKVLEVGGWPLPLLHTFCEGWLKGRGRSGKRNGGGAKVCD